MSSRFLQNEGMWARNRGPLGSPSPVPLGQGLPLLCRAVPRVIPHLPKTPWEQTRPDSGMAVGRHSEAGKGDGSS